MFLKSPLAIVAAFFISELSYNIAPMTQTHKQHPLKMTMIKS